MVRRRYVVLKRSSQQHITLLECLQCNTYAGSECFLAIRFEMVCVLEHWEFSKGMAYFLPSVKQICTTQAGGSYKRALRQEHPAYVTADGDGAD